MTAIYVIKGGMYSVVLTEVLQFAIMTVACIGIAVIAMNATTAEQIAQATPKGWASFDFSWMLALDWTAILPAANDQIASDGFLLFALFLMMSLFKGIFQSAADPAPNYDMQRILSTRSPREASLMSGVVTLVLIIPRNLLITGLTVLALVYFSPNLRAMGDKVDFEAILPLALANFIPVGLLGLILAGLLAAFMSSFAAALNAAPAYAVNDIYKRYIRPDADDRHYVRLSYAVSTAFVMIGTAIGLLLESVQGMVLWITSGLYGGYTAANVLKWYWWRLNGYGYFWGMVAGIGFALLLGLPVELNPLLSVIGSLYGMVPGLEEVRVDALTAFPVLFVICLVVCVAARLLSSGQNMESLKQSYRTTRPWGLWAPVRRALVEEGQEVEHNKDFTLDMFNVLIGIVWQTAITAMPIFFVIKSWTGFAVFAAVVAANMIILKFSRFDRMDQHNVRSTPNLDEAEPT